MNPWCYLLARISLWIFPTAKALTYVQRVDTWRQKRCSVEMKPSYGSVTTQLPLVIEFEEKSNRVYILNGSDDGHGRKVCLMSDPKHVDLIAKEAARLVKDALLPECECGHGHYHHYGVGLWPRREGGHCSFSCGNRDPGCDCTAYRPKEV